jgi:hypothetical protein
MMSRRVGRDGRGPSGPSRARAPGTWCVTTANGGTCPGYRYRGSCFDHKSVTA